MYLKLVFQIISVYQSCSFCNIPALDKKQNKVFVYEIRSILHQRK